MDILFALFLFFARPADPPLPDKDCDSYVVGFRGLGRAFDQAAFDQYADRRGSCSLVYDYTEIDQAVEFVNTLEEPYELYGYSAGAVAVGQVLKKAEQPPRYAVTIGALASVDVDFDRYGVKFDNWFDDSGRGSRSPGRYLPGVGHDRIQQHVNQFYQ
jgi:hypothetical protein